MKATVYFVVPSSGEIWGSTFLRGLQMCEVAKRHVGEDYDFQIIGMPMLRNRALGLANIPMQYLWAATRPSGAIYIVMKQCIEGLSSTAAEMLQSRARGVIFDYVDADMSRILMRGADIHLCASYAQYSYISERLNNNGVQLMLHNYDARFEVLPAKTAGTLGTVYLGAIRNTYIPPNLREKVDIFEGSSYEDMNIQIDSIGGYNFHYCVRPPTVTRNQVIFKPFTKGATAAVCGANVLVNKETHDAVQLLGDDYPYLVDTLDDVLITEKFAAAEAGVGGADWQRAISVMAELAFQLSPEQAALKLHKILKPMSE